MLALHVPHARQQFLKFLKCWVMSANCSRFIVLDGMEWPRLLGSLAKQTCVANARFCNTLTDRVFDFAHFSTGFLSIQ